MTITVPRAGMVILIGASASGKSTFARKHFRPTEIVSSDVLRGVVADNEASMRATNDAFELVHAIAAARLRHGRLAVIDATNVEAKYRADLVAIARAAGLPLVAVVLDLPEVTLLERSRQRTDRRPVPETAILSQIAGLRRSLAKLGAEGYDAVYVLAGVQDVESATVQRG